MENTPWITIAVVSAYVIFTYAPWARWIGWHSMQETFDKGKKARRGY